MIPETIISTNNIILQNQDTSILRITNKSETEDALFRIVCQGQSTVKGDGLASDHCPRASFGLPRWLEVTFLSIFFGLNKKGDSKPTYKFDGSPRKIFWFKLFILNI